MFRVLLALAVVPLLAALATGQDGMPKGPAPRIVAAYPDPNGQPVLVYPETTMVVVPVEVEAKVGNRTEKRIVMKYVPQISERRIALDKKNVRLFNGAGKPLDLQDVRKHFKKAGPVLISADGKEVDPFYLRMVRPDTLVVVTPDLVGPQVVPVLLPKVEGVKDAPLPKDK